MNYSREPNIRLDRRRRHGALASLLTAAFVTILTLLVMLFVTSAPVEGQDDRSINDSISASRALVADDLYRVTAAGPLSSLTLPLNVAPASSGNGSGPIVSFTTTTPLLGIEGRTNTYFGVEEGEVGEFWIVLDRVADQDVTLEVYALFSHVGDKITYEGNNLTQEIEVIIPAGQSSTPSKFKFNAKGYENDKYSTLIRQNVTEVHFTIVEAPNDVTSDENILSVRWLEDDIPTLSLDFPASADYDEVLEEGDSFEVVVGTDIETDNDRLRIEADLVAYADGVALDWTLPSVTIPAFETKTLVVVKVPPGSVAGLVGKEVVLGLENAIVKDTGRDREDVRVKATDTLILNAAPIGPKVSLSTDSLTLVEGESATVTVEVSGDISNVGTATLMLVVSDEKFKDDYRIIPEKITLAQARAGFAFEIGAVDDEDYDPGESFVLELKTVSNSIQLTGDNRLVVNIDDNDPLPYILFATNSGSWNHSLEVEEGEVGYFFIALDRKSNYDVTLTLTTRNCCNRDEDNLRYVKYIDPGTGQEVDLTQTRTVTIPAGSLSIPFTLDGRSLEDEEYKTTYGVHIIPHIGLAFDSLFVRLFYPYYMYLSVLEDDIPTLSLDFADSADDDGVLEEGDSFDVVVTTSNLIGSEYLRIEANLKASADGVDLGWNIPPVTINEGERDVTVTVRVPSGSIAELVGKDVTLELDNAIGKETNTARYSRQISLEMSNILTLNTATPKVSLSTDSLTLVEGESATVTIDVSGNISNVSDETLMFVVSDERFKDDYRVKPSYITLAQAREGYTFEIGAVDDEDYDPGESFVLELVPSSSSIQLTGDNRLVVNIDDNDPLPFISFTTNPGSWDYHSNAYSLGVEEGEVGEFWIALDRKSNYDVTLTLTTLGNEDNLRYVTYIDPGTGQEVDLTQTRTVTLPAGSLSIPFTLDTRGFDDEEYKNVYGVFIPDIVLAFDSLFVRFLSPFHIYLGVSEDDTPTLSLDFADPAEDGGVLEEGDSFDVVVTTSNLIGSENFRIEANLKASADGVDLGWNIPPVTINDGERGVTVTVSVPEGSVAGLVGKEVVLELDDAIAKQINTRHLRQVSLEVSNTLILQSAPPIVSFTTTTPLLKVKTRENTYNTYFGVEEGEVGEFWIVLDRVSDQDVKLEVRALNSNEGDKITYEGNNLTQEIEVMIPAGQLSTPFKFKFNATGYEDDKYSALIRQNVTEVYFTIVEAPDDVIRGKDSLSLRWLEDDIPTLSLDFPASADYDEVLEEGDSFEVVVGTDIEIGNDRLRIEADLVAYADGVALDWTLPSVTIPAFETKTLETVDVPPGSLAGLVGKEVVLGLENAIVKNTHRNREDVRVKATDTLILNVAPTGPKVSLSTDTLTLVEGESATVTVEVVGSISGVADETLTLIVSDEKFKDDYRVKPSYITLAQAQEGYTFEIGAVDDRDYDPRENFVLELKLSSSTVQVAGDNRLVVNIDDNDPVPVISFNVFAPWRKIYHNGHNGSYALRIRIPEGDIGQFEVTLDRKSNRDVIFELNAAEYNNFPLDGLAVLPPYGISIEEWSTGVGVPYGGRPLTIPAGKLSVLFTVDIDDYDDNEIFNRHVIGGFHYGNLKINIVPPGSPESIVDTKFPLLTLEELGEDIPTLSLKLADPAAAGKLEGRDSFDVVVETSKVVDDDYRIEANLRAYAVSPEGSMTRLRWNIPSVRINSHTPDITVTVRFPEYSIAQFVDKEVVLKLENARVVRKDSGSRSEISLEVSNTLTLNAGPKASLSTDSLTLAEGESGTITIELFGDIDYVGGYTLTLVQQSGMATKGTDYELTPMAIYVAETTTEAVFEVEAFENDGFDPGEKAVFKLMPSSQAVQMVGQTEFTLNIVENTPHASIGKSLLMVEEGRTAIIPIEVNGNISLAADETFTLLSSNGAFKDDYRITPAEITLTDAKAGSTFEVEIFESDGYDPDRRVVLELRSNSDTIEILSSTLVLNIVDNGIYASLITNTLTLSEGEVATIRVKVDGDVSSVPTEKFTLAPSDEAFRGNYRVTPADITLADAQAGGTFEVEAVDNDIYDSGGSFVLELRSTLETTRFVTSPQLAVTVLNDDTPPLLAFAGDGIYREGKNAYLNVDEGDVREFAIELDRESNESVYVSVFLNDDTRAVTAEQLGDKRIPFIGLRQEPQDRGARGWSLGGDISRDYWLTIPAGTRSVTLTVNFEDIIDNRLSSLQNRDVVTLYFGIEGDTSGAITDLSSSRLTIRQVEDDTPKVSLTTNPDDPSVTVTESGRVEVMEGSSFEVWIDLAGKEINADFNLEVTLTATVMTGAALDLELSTVAYSSGATVTVDVIGDNLANGNRKVVFELERVVLKEKVAPWLTTGYELALPLPDSPTLTVYVIDDEVPTVSLSQSELNLNEGQTGKVIVELRGNLDSLIDTKLVFEPQAGGSADADDYTIPTITIGDEVSGLALKTYTVEIYAIHSDGLERLETVVLQLNPSVDRIDVLSPNGLRLNIVDNSPRASLSVDQLTLAEGETMTVEIVLGGDLGSIVGDTLGLVPLADRNIDYPATEGEDYESSVIEVRADHYTYTIELSVTDDTAYDPDEQVELDVGLKSEPPLSGVEFTSLNSLRLRIVNNDDFPTISFADASEKLTITEGEVATITVELDASSNRRIEVELKFDKDNAYEAASYGYDLAGSFYPPSVVLEAGDLSTELVIDARLLANDISIFDEDDRDGYEIGDLEFRISNHERSPYYEDKLKVRASEDTDNQRKIYIKDDELEPTLTLRHGQSDPRARIEVSEGETFNVWVGLSHSYDDKVSSIVEVYSDNTNRIDGIEFVEISEDTSGTLYTFMVKDDAEYRSIPETVVLSFDNYAEGDEDREQAVTFEIDGDYYYRNLNISNDFTVTVLADKIPTAQFNGERGYLVEIHEGESGTIVVDLPDDLPETLTLELEPVDETGVLASDIDISTLKVTVLRGVRQAVFNVVALDDNEYDRGDWFRFELTSPDEITILGDPIVVSIIDNDAPPTISFTDSDYVAVEAGETTAIGIKLSHPSKEITTVGLVLRHSDKPGSIDAGEYPDYAFFPEMVTIAPGETYTTITYDTRVLEDLKNAIPPDPGPTSIVEGFPNYRHLGDLEFVMPEIAVGDFEFVRFPANREDGKDIPLVVIDVPEISFVDPETLEPYKQTRKTTFAGPNPEEPENYVDNLSKYVSVLEGETTTIGVNLSRPVGYTITVNLLLRNDYARPLEYDSSGIPFTPGNVKLSDYDTGTFVPEIVTIAPGETYATIVYGTGKLHNAKYDIPDIDIPGQSRGTVFTYPAHRYLGDLEFVIPEGDKYVRTPHNRLMGGYVTLVVIEDDPKP